MIWILLSVLYVVAGYLYADVAWNSPEVKEELEKLHSMPPSEMIDRELAVAKISRVLVVLL